MKKFAFSLDALFEYKKEQKEQRQKECAEAGAKLERELAEKDALENTYRDETEIYEKKIKKGMTVGDIEAYAAYFRDLRGKIAAAARRVSQAREEAEAKRDALVTAFREVKSLEKLRGKQYAEYLAEAGKRETKLNEDNLAFKISGREAKQTVS